ncbi:DUF2062 domain-containing protein [Mucispirillum schaedleri]|uniref:DUF2062 domain-containing protein n=1 Tax=Mucispirillum schaedleri TaxID=248039 RepID=UPI001F55C949|nr:DUF2062 domain-containing protein [Mucispirillum schaedleri]
MCKKIKNYFNNLYRYCYLKLIIPIKKERHNPKYIAWGTAVGLFCGFTPIVWQMNIVLLIWFIARFFKFYFSLPIGLAWTWVSNSFTNLPLFYLYYITGSFIMGQETGGYNEFISFFENGLMEGIKQTFIFWGKPIILGSFAFMMFFSITGYFISYRYACRLRDNWNVKRIKNKLLEEVL